MAVRLHECSRIEYVRSGFSAQEFAGGDVVEVGYCLGCDGVMAYRLLRAGYPDGSVRRGNR